VLVGHAARVISDPASISMALVGELLFWLLLAAVLAIVFFWEKQTLGSLWLQPFRWSSIGWALILVAANYAVLAPTGEWVRRTAGLPGFGAGMEQVMRFPIWYRMFAVLGAGVVEEMLFRGYAVTRIAMLTRRLWPGPVLALLVFSVMHLPLWGRGFVVGGLVSGAAAMAFFVWRRDLLAMIVFHLITDAVGLVIAPLYSEWWKTPALF